MRDTSGPDLVGSERDVLLYYLNKMRDAAVRTSEGLTDEQQRTPGVPSGTNLLGVIQHLTGVEVHWFERVFLGQDRDIGDSMDVRADATHDEVVAAYRGACARSDEIVRACPDLSTMAKIANPGEDQRDSLRRIVAHSSAPAPDGARRRLGYGRHAWATSSTSTRRRISSSFVASSPSTTDSRTKWRVQRAGCTPIPCSTWAWVRG